MADYVVERTHIIDHDKFLRAGPHARDLWEWGMKWAGKHETDGKIPMSAVLASPWGHGGKANIKAATKLVDVGLWDRIDEGFLVLKWTEMGNKTKAQLESVRHKWRGKKAMQRSGDSSPPTTSCPPGTLLETPQGTPSNVLNSLSFSPSSGSSLSGRDPEPSGDSMPAWFIAACETAAMSACDVPDTDRHARWVQFLGSMERRKLAPTQTLAGSWLVSTIRGEREKAANAREPRGGGSRGNRQPLGDWKPTGTGGEF